MKKTLFSILMVVLMAFTVNAQWTTGYNPEYSFEKTGGILTFKCTLDSAGGTSDSLISRVFSLEDFDGVEHITVYHLFTTTGTPNVMVDLYGSMDNSNFVLIKQVIDTTTSELAVFAADSLNNIRAKYYKAIFENLQASDSTVTVDVRFLLPKRDY